MTHSDDVFKELMIGHSDLNRDSDSGVNGPQESIPLSETDQDILQYLSERPIHIDDIVVKTKRSISQVLQLLTIMEMKSIVAQSPGQYYSRLL